MHIHAIFELRRLRNPPPPPARPPARPLLLPLQNASNHPEQRSRSGSCFGTEHADRFGTRGSKVSTVLFVVS